ncbi:unnamed protein product, partial [Ixodes pacificus]
MMGTDQRSVPFTCRYIFGVRGLLSGPNYLQRDLGNGNKTTSLILDTDNCHYLVQLECFPDGS